MLTDLNERRPALETYQDFYDGNTNVEFIGEDISSAVGKKLRKQAVNRIQPIIDLTLDKLNLEGWSDGDEASEDDELADELWHDLELDILQHRVHFDALVKGAGYLLLWTNADDELIVGVQEPENIALHWDAEDPDKIDAAIKVWRTSEGTYRLNVYTDSALQKYVTTRPHNGVPILETAWAEHSDEGDTAWPIKHAFGVVPIFHFKVSPQSACYGNSDVDQLVSPQEKLNTTLAYESVALEKSSWPDRWVTGFDIIKDEDGNPISPFSADAESIWAIASKHAQFGQFQGSDLAQYEDALEGDEARLARTARVPMHYLLQNGNAPSGEALKTAEAMWTSKIVARQRQFGLVWTRLIRLVMFLKHGTDPKRRFYPLWSSAQTRDETALVNRMVVEQSLIAQGKYAAQTLKKLGYTHDEIGRFEELRVERQHEQSQRVLEGLA